MDSDSIWKKNVLFNNGTVDVSRHKKNKNKIYQKDIIGIDELEVLEIQQRIENIHTKKRKYSKSPIFDSPFNPFVNIVEGFDLVMDNSGNFQKVENEISDGVKVLNNEYSEAMNIVAQHATDTATNIKKMSSNAATVAGNTISADITYAKDSIYDFGIETELSIVNMISNLIEPQDFADRELQEDLKNNRIFVVQSYGGYSGCKTVSKPYKAPAGPDYNALLNTQYAKSVLGSQTVANIPPNSVQIENNNSTETTQNLNNTSIALLEAEQVASTASYTINAIYENSFVQFIIQNLRIIEFPFIYWRWFIKKIGIMWCNFIYTVTSSFYKEKYSHPTDYEKRMVIANMNSLVSFLFSVLISYNWFFLMYYDFNGDKINTYNLSVKSLKSFSGIINFIFQYVAYPLECMDWLMLHFIPKWTLRLFRSHMNFVFIMTYAFFSFVTLTSIGPATIDLFYDSLKLFFNGTLKPWQPALVHTYTSFWKSFYNFGDTSSTTVKYSVTLSTYVFLHIMIFYAQIPDLIPSFFKSGGGDGGGGLGLGEGIQSAVGDLSGVISGVGQALANTANNAAGQMANIGAAGVGLAATGIGAVASAIPSNSNNGPTQATEDKSKNDPTKATVDKSKDQNKATVDKSKNVQNNAVKQKLTNTEKIQANIAKTKANIKESNAKAKSDFKWFGNKIKNAFSFKSPPPPPPTEQHHPTAQHPTTQPHRVKRGGGIGDAMIGSFASKLNPLSYMPKLPGLGALSSIGDAVTSPFAGTILGALGNIIVAIIRFCLSQYLVNIAAFLVATYLLWYSFFGIFWFSKLSLFSTIKEIDMFILKHSIDYVYESCVSYECKNRTIWERIKEIFVYISKFSFPLIFYITIFFILINSCLEYTNATSGMKSSPYIKYGMMTSSIIAILLVAIRGYVTFIYT